MPVKVVPRDKLTKATRQKESAIAYMPEFADAKLKLQHGLKQYEAMEITWPRSNERGKKHLRVAFKKGLRAYLETLGLLDSYQVTTWADPTTEYVQVVHEEPLTKPAMPKRARKVT